MSASCGRLEGAEVLVTVRVERDGETEDADRLPLCRDEGTFLGREVTDVTGPEVRPELRPVRRTVPWLEGGLPCPDRLLAVDDLAACVAEQSVARDAGVRNVGAVVPEADGVHLRDVLSD